ncbi:MAG: hypothetical protein N4Q32_04405, partial [Neisseriaceae bacterium]|nr:hypothetical protein [Neisseriaceae bacterium]
MFRIKKIVLQLSLAQIGLCFNIGLADSLSDAPDKKNSSKEVVTKDELLIKNTCSSTSGKFEPIEPIETSQEPVPDNGGVRLTFDKKVEGKGSEEALVEGNVIVEHEEQVLNANKVLYKNNRLSTSDPFKLKDSSNILSG